ncbi:MAG: hypothetical protein U0892_01545 [Pirellulales bacterium]
MSAAVSPSSSTTLTPMIDAEDRDAVWIRLLWKEWRQMQGAWIGSLAVLVVLQAIPMISGWIDGTNGGTSSSLVFAFLAPSLMAIGSAGIQFGQERQTRSWNWQSSLPLGWKTALISKALVWMLSSVMMTALLLVTSAGYRALDGISPNPFDISDSEFSGGIPMMLAVAFDLFVILSLFALLLREPLPALAFGAVFVVGVQAAFLPWVSYSIANNVLHFEPMGSRIWFVTAVAVFIASLIAFVLTFRWRWTYGQNAELFLSPDTSASSPVILEDRSAYLGAASEFIALLRHSFRTALGLRAAVVLLAVFVIAWAGSYQLSTSFDSQREGAADFAIAVVLAASVALGYSTFAGDTTHDRFRFYSDRGVRWTKLLTTRCLMPLTLAILLVLALSVLVLFRSSPFTRDYVPLLIILAFPFGVLSALTFASEVVGFVLSLLLMFAYFAAMSMSMQGLENITANAKLIRPMYPVTIAVLSAVIVCVGIIRVLPRKLVEYRAKAGLLYSGIAVCCICTFPVITFFFGYLALPNVGWVPQSMAEAFRSTPVPVSLTTVEESFGDKIFSNWIRRGNEISTAELEGLTNLTAMSLSTDGSDEVVRGSSEDAIRQDTLRKRIEARLEIIRHRQKLIQENSWPRAQTAPIVDSISYIAIIAAAATHDGQKDQATEAWTIVKQQLEGIRFPWHQSYVIEARIAVFELWRAVMPDALKLFGSREAVLALMPADLTIEEANEVVKSFAALQTEFYNFDDLESAHRAATELGFSSNVIFTHESLARATDYPPWQNWIYRYSALRPLNKRLIAYQLYEELAQLEGIRRTSTLVRIENGRPVPVIDGASDKFSSFVQRYHIYRNRYLAAQLALQQEVPAPQQPNAEQ